MENSKKKVYSYIKKYKKHIMFLSVSWVKGLYWSLRFRKSRLKVNNKLSVLKYIKNEKLTYQVHIF